ncbi:MAG: B3/B4 domain-containing protein [Thermoprotei archaeon]
MGIFVAFNELSDVTNGYPAFEEEVKKFEEKYSKGDLEGLKDDPIVRAYRDFYWRLGVDPTKTRPAGEALRRRLIKDGKLPRINFIVDVGNLVSAKTLVPIGIYDRKKFVEEPIITLTRGGEEFLGIGKKRAERLPPGIPVMMSGSAVMHIYPHRDSLLTSVDDNTKDVLVVCAGVPGVPESLVKEACDGVKGLLVNYGKAKVVTDTMLVT